jgi:hypothetical protein
MNLKWPIIRAALRFAIWMAGETKEARQLSEALTRSCFLPLVDHRRLCAKRGWLNEFDRGTP